MQNDESPEFVDEGMMLYISLLYLSMPILVGYQIIPQIGYGALSYNRLNDKR